MKDVEIRLRKLNELDVYDGKSVTEGDRIWINEWYRDALLANPFVTSPEMACQKIGYVDGKAGGTVIVFPLLIKADGRVCRTGSGSLTVVDQWARKYGLGFAMSDTGHKDDGSETEIGEGAGLSQIAVKVHRFLEYTVFEYPRFIVLWKGRAVVERFVNGRRAKILQWLIDPCICVYGLFLSAMTRFKLRDFEVVSVEGDDDTGIAAIESLIDLDGHRFSEVHDKRWIKWHLNHSFSKHGPAKAFLVRRRSDGIPVAFYMTKRRFHEQASGRGFRNVWLGSIIEWGCLSGFENVQKWAIVSAVVSMRKDTDAVEFATNDRSLQKFVRRFGWRQVGCANFCFKIVEGVADLAGNPAIIEQSNWRLRPAMGDGGLN
jgi:hypothetical protein